MKTKSRAAREYAERNRGSVSIYVLSTRESEEWAAFLRQLGIEKMPESLMIEHGSAALRMSAPSPSEEKQTGQASGSKTMGVSASGAQERTT